MNKITALQLKKRLELKEPLRQNIAPTMQEAQFLQRLLKARNIIILSPHLDDALLSTGSLLGICAAQKIPVHIYNVFTQGTNAKSDLNIRLLKQANVSTHEEYFIKRKLEDQNVFSSMYGSINITNLDHVDAAWRTNSDGIILYEKVLGSYHDYDEAFIKALTLQLSELIGNNANTLIFAPLGIGQHADHLIVRNAASALDNHVIYYADFPYSNEHGIDKKFIEINKLDKIIFREGDYANKKKQIAMYVTQRLSIFNTKNLQMSYETFYINPDFLTV